MLSPCIHPITILDFEDITKYEIIFDNHIVKENVIGNAIVGGILAGGVGAIVGASATNSKQIINQVVIHIYQKSGLPVTYTLSSQPLSRISNEYAQLVQKLDVFSEFLDHAIQYQNIAPDLIEKADNILNQMNYA